MTRGWRSPASGIVPFHPASGLTNVKAPALPPVPRRTELFVGLSAEFGGQAVLLDDAVEAAARDLQDLGGLRLVAARLGQDVLHVGALHVGQGAEAVAELQWQGGHR